MQTIPTTTIRTTANHPSWSSLAWDKFTTTFPYGSQDHWTLKRRHSSRSICCIFRWVKNGFNKSSVGDMGPGGGGGGGGLESGPWKNRSIGTELNRAGYEDRSRILGRIWDKSLQSFPPCYSQSPLLTDYTPPPPQKWFENGFYCKHYLRKPQVWELSRLCPETSTKLYVHEFSFRVCQ